MLGRKIQRETELGRGKPKTMRNIMKAALGFLSVTFAGTATYASAQSYGDYSNYGYSNYSYSNYGATNYGSTYYGNNAYAGSSYSDPYGASSYYPYYSTNVYDGCDYYTPPWGYPSNFCDYDLWYEPVYYGGYWYSGPIYSQYAYGAHYFCLNGDWRTDEWRGTRPRDIDWGHGRNIRWSGEVHHGGPGGNRDVNNRGSRD